MTTLALTPREATDRIRTKALRDYRRGDRLRDIAVRYGKSPTAISLWAKKAGLERRQQGCTIKKWPDASDIDIVNAVKAAKQNDNQPTLEEIGERFGHLSRAGVHRIFMKWKNWKPRIPFKPGDQIRLDGHDYLVLVPGVFTGKVRDMKTQEEQDISWTHEQKMFRRVRGGKKRETCIRIMAVKLN